MMLLRWCLLVILLAVVLVANMPLIVSQPAALYGNPLYGWSSRAAEAKLDIELQGGDMDEGTWTRLKEDGQHLLRRAPASGEALGLISYADRQLGGPLDHSELTSMAIDRDPRSVLSIYADIERRVRLQDYDGVVAGLNSLIRVQPEIGKSIGQVISQLLTSPASRDALLDVPAATRWRGPVLAALLNSKTPKDVGYATSFLRRTGPGEFRDLKSRAVNLAIGDGRLSDATSLWTGFFQNGETPPRLVRDPDFDGEAPPPFGWAFLEEAEGVARRSPQGGVDVVYRSRLTKPLISQLLTLPKGSFRLIYEGTSPKRGVGKFKVQITCSDDVVPLATIELPRARMSGPKRRLSDSFRVPDGSCPAQTLALVGQNGSRSLTQELEVARLDVLPARTVE